MRCLSLSAISALLVLPVAAASLQSGKPEDVGLSTERLQRIHEMIQQHIDAHEMSGAVTLVARKGRIAHFEAQGMMDLESKKRMPKDGLFWIASMSKPITGVAVLMLLEEGKIRLTDPVSKFIPEFRGMKVAAGEAPRFYTVPAAREITIRDLLTHVSGLVSGGPMSTAELEKIDHKKGEKLADFIPRLGTTTLDFQPGSRWGYSATAGFDTLGRIVEIVSGQTFDRFLRQRIFLPLSMQDTSFRPPESQIPRLVTIYDRTETGSGGTGAGMMTKAKDDGWLDNIAPTYFSGGGGLIDTTEDYVRFAQMLLNGGELDGKRLLSPKTVVLMSSVFVPDISLGGLPREAMGFGLSVRVVRDPVALLRPVSAGSYGWDGYYGTFFWVDPKEKLVAVLMIQTENTNLPLERDFENAVRQAIVE